jgi:hypothetical protein
MNLDLEENLMRMLYRGAVVASVIASSFVVHGTELTATEEIDSCDCMPECIVAYVTRIASGGEYTEKDAESVSEHCEERAVSPLRNLMSLDEVPFHTKGFAALCLGKIGTADCEAALLDYIQLSRSEPISVDEYISIQMALYGLGFVGSDEAIKFLRLLCSADYWLNRDDIAMFTSATNAQGQEKQTFGIDEWRGFALAGFQALEPEKEREELQLLRADETYEALFPSIDSKIAASNKN